MRREALTRHLTVWVQRRGDCVPERHLEQIKLTARGYSLDMEKRDACREYSGILASLLGAMVLP